MEPEQKRFINPGVKGFADRASFVAAIAHNSRDFELPKDKLGNEMELRHIDSNCKLERYVSEPWRKLLKQEYDAWLEKNRDNPKAKVFPEFEKWTCSDAFDFLQATCRINGRVKHIGAELGIFPSHGALYPADAPDEFKNRENKRFFDECADYVTKKVGAENVIRMDLHPDETTPHFHALFVPRVKAEMLSEKGARGKRGERVREENRKSHKLSFTDIFGKEVPIKSIDTDERGFAGLHTEVAKVIGEKFNLERGERYSAAKNISNKRFRKIVELAGSKMEEDLQPPRFGKTKEWVESIRDQYAAALAKAASVDAANDNAMRLQERLEAQKAKSLEDRKVLEDQISKLKQEVSEKEIRAKPLSEVLEKLGYSPLPYADDETKLRRDGQFGREYMTHKGLLLVDETDSKYTFVDENLKKMDFKNASGKGSVSLVMGLEFSKTDQAFANAMKYLSALFNEDEIQKERLAYLNTSPAIGILASNLYMVETMAGSENAFLKVRDELISKGVSPDLIDKLRSEGRIFVNTKGQFCARYFDENGVETGMSACDLNGHYLRYFDKDDYSVRREAKFAVEREGVPKRLTVVENPLDVLKLASIYDDESVASVVLQKARGRGEIDNFREIPKLLMDDSQMAKYDQIIFAADRKPSTIELNVLDNERRKTKVKAMNKSSAAYGEKTWLNVAQEKCLQVFAALWGRKHKDSRYSRLDAKTKSSKDSLRDLKKEIGKIDFADGMDIDGTSGRSGPTME